MTGTWAIVASGGHALAACLAATVTVWLLGRAGPRPPGTLATVAALALTASWGLASAAAGTDSAAASLAEALRNLGWLAVLWVHLRDHGAPALVRTVRLLVLTLAGIEVLLIALIAMLPWALLGPERVDALFDLSAAFRMIECIGALVLLHNLYGNAPASARSALRWQVGALALLWGYDLNLYTVAWLDTGWPAILAALRGFVVLGSVALLLAGLTRRADRLSFQPSHAAAFRFASLITIGVYLGAMFALAQWLAYVGGDLARLLQFGFLIAASVLALLSVPSRRMRGWLKVTLFKHLFRHRYDYRAEWQRFARTIGRGGDGQPGLEARAIKAVADITDSPAGLLLVPGDHGDLQLAASWQWADLDVPACAMDARSAAWFERTGYIVELDALRAGKELLGEGEAVPAWLLDAAQAWTMVPLRHNERLAGVVVVARPAHPQRLDWEDFDLLRVVGQQLATTLSERAGQDALLEAARFDEFNRRIAFVMHDIKNLASQFALLARNAEHHAENPAFRADMIVTLKNSADKLNALIARLSRYGAGGRDKASEVDAGDIVRSVIAQFTGTPRVQLSQCGGGTVSVAREGIEQALVHLVQNALDASAARSPVFVAQGADGLTAWFEVVDSGHGMSPEFIRNRLFKPFVSTKDGGFGIGAFEARELVRAAGGRLDVESREGIGTRFTIRLPLAAATAMQVQFDNREQKVA